MNTPAATRWKIIASLLVVAVSAGGIGGILGWKYREERLIQERRDQSSIHLLYLSRLEEALALTPGQRARIAPVLDAASERTRKLSAQVATDAARIREDMRAAILPALTAEQRAAYEKFEADRDARHDRVRGNVRSYLDSKPKRSTPSPP
jgi:hypothetical protein